MTAFNGIVFGALLLLSVGAFASDDNNSTQSQASTKEIGITEKIFMFFDGIGKDLGDFTKSNHLFMDESQNKEGSKTSAE